MFAGRLRLEYMETSVISAGVEKKETIVSKFQNPGAQYRGFSKNIKKPKATGMIRQPPAEYLPSGLKHFKKEFVGFLGINDRQPLQHFPA